MEEMPFKDILKSLVTALPRIYDRRYQLPYHGQIFQLSGHARLQSCVDRLSISHINTCISAYRIEPGWEKSPAICT